MSKAIAFTRQKAAHAPDAARFALVSACALALIAAGQAFPILM